MARAYILRFKVILMSIVSRHPEHMDQQQAHASRSPGLTWIWHGERGKAGESSTSQEEALTVPKTQRVSVILPTYVTGFRMARNISEFENSKFIPIQHSSSVFARFVESDTLGNGNMALSQLQTFPPTFPEVKVL